MDKDEKSQLFDYVPLNPSDGYNFTIKDPELQEKLEVYKQQTEAYREKFLVQKAEFDPDMQRLEAAKEEPDEKKGEDEEMTDVSLDDDPMSEWFQCPSKMTRWKIDGSVAAVALRLEAGRGAVRCEEGCAPALTEKGACGISSGRRLWIHTAASMPARLGDNLLVSGHLDWK